MKPEQAPTPPTEPEPSAPSAPDKNWRKYLKNKKILGAAGVVIVVIVAGIVIWQLHGNSKTVSSTAAASQNSQTAAKIQGLQLDPNKDYGNKYADGILPVGDGKYQTSGPETGYVYVCQGYATNLQSQPGGASRRGPWFIGTTKYDINKKLAVEGNVHWNSEFSDKVSGSTRVITSNDLPNNHPTGIFPISATDPAYAYDKNPNSIQAQSFTYDLSASPTYGSPACVGGQVGVMLTGVALFSAFDAGGRDAGAWEVQDSCDGHPEKTGTYHYHTLSSCIKDTSVKTVIGFALDGFPITGPQVGTNNILTTADLDECHGITSQIVLDGKNVTMYHYVMTQDFPYSVSCYRGTAIQPPGIGENKNATGGQGTSGGSQTPPSSGSGGGQMIGNPPRVPVQQ